MFKIEGWYSTWTGPQTPARLQVHAVVASPELAREIVARFPRSLRMRASHLTSWAPDGATIHQGYISLDVKLFGDDANQGRNEAGIARYRRFRKLAAQLGYDVTYQAGKYTNAYLDEAALECALAGEWLPEDNDAETDRSIAAHELELAARGD